MIKPCCKVPKTEAAEPGSVKWRCRTKKNSTLLATQKTGYVYQIGLATCVSESDKRTTRLGSKAVRLCRTYGDRIYKATNREVSQSARTPTDNTATRMTLRRQALSAPLWTS
jgi:hypothetical protein